MRPILRVLCLLSCAMLILTACEQDVVIDPKFSVNVFSPGPKWPNVKKLKPVEREVFEKYGKPDRFRVWWNPTGELRTRFDVEQEFRRAKPKDLPPYSWIYLSSGIEVRLTASGYQEQPVTDQVRLMTQYGDPEDVKELKNGLTQWMYYSVGKLYKFGNGMIVEEKEFPAMGSFHKK